MVPNKNYKKLIVKKNSKPIKKKYSFNQIDELILTIKQLENEIEILKSQVNDNSIRLSSVNLGQSITKRNKLSVVILLEPLQKIYNFYLKGKQEKSKGFSEEEFIKFPAKVLFLTATDLMGQQFNGYLLSKALIKNGLGTAMSVAFAQSDDRRIFIQNQNTFVRKFSQKYIHPNHEKKGLQSIQPDFRYSSIFPKKHLKKVDIIHLQLPYAGPFFNIKIIPKLSKKHKLIITLHDQWFLTGHCTHPLDCPGASQGCGNCPDLARVLPVQFDNTAKMWKIKKNVFKKAKNIQLIVASNWMLEKVKQSPILGHLPCKVIPFGVDTRIFYPVERKSLSSSFSFPENKIIISFRSNPSIPYKGFEYIEQALEKIKQLNNIIILTVGETGVLEKWKSYFEIHEFGWISNQDTLREFYSATDIFLAPSIVESFGLMPIEAMHCGAVPMVFKTTPLEENVNSPIAGIAVPYMDGNSLGKTLFDLISNKEEIFIRKKKCISFARNQFSFDNYVQEHRRIYQESIKTGSSIKQKIIQLFSKKSVKFTFKKISICLIRLSMKIVSIPLRIKFKNKNNRHQDKFMFLSHVLPPTFSGQSVITGRILKNIDPKYFNLIMTRNPVPSNKQISPLEKEVNIIAQHFPVYENIDNVRRFLFYSCLEVCYRGYKIAQKVNQNRCKSIVVCSGDLHDLPAAYLASLLTKSKLFVYYLDDYRNQWGTKRELFFAGLMEDMIITELAGGIVPNEFMRDSLAERYLVPTQIIRNVLNEDILNNLPDKLSPIWDKNQKFNLVFTGSIYSVNAHAIVNVLKALEMIGDNHFEFHIYTAQSIEHLKGFGIQSKYLHYHSHIPSLKVNEVQKKADLLIMPFSNVSGLDKVIFSSAPSKFYEYLVSGVPLLAHVPDNCFVSWYIKKYDCGSLVPFENNQESINKLAETIINIRRNKQLIENYVSNALKSIKSDLWPEIAAKEFIKFVFPQSNVPSGNLKPNIAFITATDLGGQQFNGYLLSKELEKRNIISYLSVAWKSSNSYNVYEYGGGRYNAFLTKFLRGVFSKIGIQSLFINYLYPSILPAKILRKANIIHLQLPHSAPFFNLLALKKISKKHHLILTIHDPWFMTGHCVHPMDCTKWITGCENCQYLERDIQVNYDNTKFMWKMKKFVFRNLNAHLIAASDWTLNNIKKSPILSKLPCEIIPLGVDRNTFYPEDKILARKKFDIDENDFVISFRAAPDNSFKGFDYIIEALEKFSFSSNTTLLFTSDSPNSLYKVSQKYNIIDLGYITDQKVLRNMFSAANVFLSPSLVESFGLMPIEAMFCGAVPIVFKGTVLEKNVSSPQIGFAVNYGDSNAICQVLEQLYKNKLELNERSLAAIEFSKNNFDYAMYVDRHITFYEKILNS